MKVDANEKELLVSVARKWRRGIGRMFTPVTMAARWLQEQVVRIKLRKRLRLQAPSVALSSHSGSLHVRPRRQA